MKRFSMFVLVLMSILCLAVCGVAEEVSTPTDTECEHDITGAVHDSETHTSDCTLCGVTMSGNSHSLDTHITECVICGEASSQLYDYVTLEPTCTLGGSKTGKCYVCGEAEVMLPPTGHTWGPPVTVEAGCLTDGSVTKTCTVCGETSMQVIQCTGHNWGGVVRVEASCFEAGSETTTCANCGEVSEQIIPATGHVNIMKHDDSQHWYGCEKCGEEIGSRENHVDDCQNLGVCLGCGATGITVNWTEHDFDTWWSDNTHHQQRCSKCGENISALLEHWEVCTNPGVCAGCGATGVTFASPAHGTVKWVANGGACQYTCLDCGTVMMEGSHMISCAGPADACYFCGISMTGQVEHNFNYLFENLGDTHRVTCEKCGEVLETNPHWVDCTNPGVCMGCGATGLGDEFISHEIVAENSSSTAHSWNCINCGTFIDEENHYAACTTPDVCMECGATGVTMETLYHEEVDPTTVLYDENTHWVPCLACDGRTWEFDHWEDCTTADGKCDSCGADCSEAAQSHKWAETGTTEATCTTDGVTTYTCELCKDTKAEVKAEATGEHAWGEAVTVEATCVADGSKTTTCTVCGEKTVETIPATGKHTWGAPVTVEPTCVTDGSKTTACTVCGEKTVETIKATGEHTWGEPVTVAATCTTDGSKTTACTKCNEKTVETIPATGDHTWETSSRTAATCTKAGRTERVCAVCDELSITTSAAKGHSYGLVFVTEGNGTHAKTCGDCGEKYVENCTMSSTEMGDMTCSACAVCGYAVYTMSDVALETVEGATDAAAQIEVKRVENVSFEVVAAPAEEGTEAETEAEAVDTSDVILVVHETELEMTVQLPDTVNANVKKVLAVNLLKEGNSIQPSSKLKLSIPVVEEEVSGLKLVLMDENGELIEIEYEIIDGVIVFETELVGIFLFVDAEA